ncbi:hypothetical protein AB0M12_33705 [Nocardia vinacea]|uniref:hypothetical protein n=1 Tax=Nocardia vinacea TaxID=96468 RepID=UPI00342A5111
MSVDIRCEEKLLRPAGWTPAHVRGLTMGVLPEVAAAATDRSKAELDDGNGPVFAARLYYADANAGMMWKCG